MFRPPRWAPSPRSRNHKNTQVVVEHKFAGVAEVADAEVSKTSGSNPLRVRVPPPA